MMTGNIPIPEENVKFIFGERIKSNIIIKVVVPPAKPGQPIPKVFHLPQNYPNPFNPDTWIPFDLVVILK